MTDDWHTLAGDLDEDETDALLLGLRSCDRAVALAHFPVWAHPGQLPPPGGGDWRTWVIMAGRGFGKTLAGAEWIKAEVAAAPADRLAIALVGATIEDARRVMVEGRSGLLAVAADWIEDWHASLGRLTFTTGAQAFLFSGASPDRLRGPEHHLAWCDELAKWEKAEATWDMLQLGLRLGTRPRALVTTTPKGGGALAGIIAEPGCVVTGGPTAANPHLPAAWKAGIAALYAGTRLGRQELDGELLADVPGALWTVEGIERCRAQGSDRAPIARQREETASVGQPAPCNGDRTDELQVNDAPHDSDHAGGMIDLKLDLVRDGKEHSAQGLEPAFLDVARDERRGERPAFVRVVIGVDPPSGDGTCGIIVCARDEAGIGHVLADHSVTARSPEGWAQAVADAARIHGVAGPDRAEAERMRAAAKGQARDSEACGRRSALMHRPAPGGAFRSPSSPRPTRAGGW